MEVFENENGDDEVPYQIWRKGHPNGFVLQTPRRNVPSYIMLHRTSCHTISNATNSPSSKPFTGEGYIKVCSENPTELMSYARSRGRSDPLSYCKTCKPEKDFPAKNPLEVLSILAKAAGRDAPTKELIQVEVFVRSSIIAKYAKHVANGSCSLCKEPVDLDPLNYLDCHHIRFLRDRGPDTRENVVGVCPNCHRRLHISPDPATVEKLRVLAERRASELDAAGVRT